MRKGWYCYTDEQIDTMLNIWFSNSIPSGSIWEHIAKCMGSSNHVAGISILLWKIVTGYVGHYPDTRRRVYEPTILRISRVGKPWNNREERALFSGFVGEGKRRLPPCDIRYMAAVLARSEEEVFHHLEKQLLW